MARAAGDREHGGAVAVELAAADAGDVGKRRRARPAGGAPPRSASRRGRSHRAAAPGGGLRRGARRAAPSTRSAPRDRASQRPAGCLLAAVLRPAARSRGASRRKRSSRAPRSTSAALGASASPPCPSGSGSRWPCASSWRITDSQPLRSSSVPTPKVLSRSWPKLPDALGRVADQDVDEMMRAEPLPGAIDRRQRLLRRHRAVPARRRARQLSQLPQGGCSRSPK